MAIFFYLFAGMLIISSVLVVISKNPVYSVLWLIFSFCNGAGLIILMGAEFLAMMLIVIYVGAVAVLFLFVIMMLNINFTELKRNLRKNLSLGMVIAVVMFTDLALIILLGTNSIRIKQEGQFVIPKEIGNIYAIGRVLYTDFILPFQLAGIILFVAMVACISLTLRIRGGVKRQDVFQQLSKNKANSLSVLNISQNTGIEGIKYNE